MAATGDAAYQPLITTSIVRRLLAIAALLSLLSFIIIERPWHLFVPHAGWTRTPECPPSNTSSSTDAAPVSRFWQPACSNGLLNGYMFIVGDTLVVKVTTSTRWGNYLSPYYQVMAGGSISNAPRCCMLRCLQAHPESSGRTTFYHSASMRMKNVCCCLHMHAVEAWRCKKKMPSICRGARHA